MFLVFEDVFFVYPFEILVCFWVLDERREDLYPEILRDEAVSRLNELGKVKYIVYVFLTFDL